MSYLRNVGTLRTVAGIVAAYINLMSITSRLGFRWTENTHEKRNIVTISRPYSCGNFLCILYRDRIGSLFFSFPTVERWDKRA